MTGPNKIQREIHDSMLTELSDIGKSFLGPISRCILNRNEYPSNMDKSKDNHKD